MKRRRIPVFTPEEVDDLLARFQPYEPPSACDADDDDDCGYVALTYLTLEQAGAYGERPGREQSQFFRQLACEYEH